MSFLAGPSTEAPVCDGGGLGKGANLTSLCLNQTGLNDTQGNETGFPPHPGGMDAWTGIFVTVYSMICIVGLVGNGLVILVVVRYAKMKTVTNMYILNLAMADLCFLVGVPFLIVTTIVRSWVFGFIMCKVFYILTSINWFTSVFTLTVMSADRYLAVCHPVRSMKYRTPIVSRIVCFLVWALSILVMFPIVLYATTSPSHYPGKESCTISWPQGQPISADKAFIWYALLLGFAIPVALISVFYALVLLRLKTVGPKKKSKEKKKSHRKVTKMVLAVIAVYVICWLPYWIFQVALTFAKPGDMPSWSFVAFQIFTVMSYANSMLNPLIYAFLSDNFRKSFIKAFKCATSAEVNGTLQVENSVFPGKKSTMTSTSMTAVKEKLRHINSEEDLMLAESNATSTTFTTLNQRPTSVAPADSPTPMLNSGDHQDPAKAIIANHDSICKETGNSTPTSV